MIVVMLCSFVLVGLVYVLFYIMFYKIKHNMESISSYECGFDPHSLTRLMFSYRFYLVSILFIIFDVEISLMLPVPFLSQTDMSLIVFVLFVLILVMGLMYEYYCGSLDWLDIHN